MLRIALVNHIKLLTVSAPPSYRRLTVKVFSSVIRLTGKERERRCREQLMDFDATTIHRHDMQIKQRKSIPVVVFVVVVIGCAIGVAAARFASVKFHLRTATLCDGATSPINDNKRNK